MGKGSLTGREIVVAGAGVAGFAVARAAALRGAKVHIVEQAAEITEVGAGLQVSPNGLCVMEAIGLGEALRSVSLAAETVVLRDGRSARRVLTLDLSRSAGRYLLVHRARLIEVLAEGAQAAGVGVTLDMRVEPGAGSGGDALTLAADGLHSAHRAALIGAGAPFFTGQVAWRAVIPDAEPRPHVEVYMGPGRHLVTYPLRGGLRNIVAVEERSAWAEEGWHHEDDPSSVRAAFSEFGGRVPDWLGRIERVNLWGLFRHPVAPKWHGQGVALLGDAAHPMLPFLAQGANMALEDAWVLADCLARHESRGAAFAAYEALRRTRVSRVVDVATANARNYHLSGLRRRLAHGALRLVGRVAPGAALGRFDWLYGHDVTRA
ncbi:MAG: FAD-dependent monooxygenase [Pseudomonadota bacterium]